MRFFHLGDLHFGKYVHNVPMVDEDQPFWLERFLEAVDEYQPDAVLIAGDVYDRRVPSVEAVRLFDHMLTELAAKNVVTLVIAGNHDSGIRLSFADRLLSENRIYIAGVVQKKLEKVTLTDEYGEVDFYLMPYLYPKAVADKAVLDHPEIDNYNQAVQELLAVQNIDETKRNVILVHQNVLSNGQAPEHSESETIVGGLGEVEASVFSAFDYVAMGHIHNAQRMGREGVRYSGCPLYYDFSECGRDKSLTMIDLGAKGEGIQVSRIPVTLLHEMKRIRGTVEELCAEENRVEDAAHYYLEAILEDPHLPAHALDKLRDIYGNNLLHVIRKPGKGEGAAGEVSTQWQQEGEKQINELFADYYYKQNEEQLSEDMDRILQLIMEQQERSGGEYVNNTDKIPLSDTEELLHMLLEEEKS